MNKWILIGNLTEDPKLFYSDKGTAVCVFTIAAESGYGKYKQTTYPQIVTYGDKAEAHAKHLGKGDKVAATGIGYQKKNEYKGKVYYNLQCKAREVEYLKTSGNNKIKKKPKNNDEEEYEPDVLDDDFDAEGFDVPF
jgi:single stranded DNA-binding protein